MHDGGHNVPGGSGSYKKSRARNREFFFRTIEKIEKIEFFSEQNKSRVFFRKQLRVLTGKMQVNIPKMDKLIYKYVLLCNTIMIPSRLIRGMNQRVNFGMSEKSFN